MVIDRDKINEKVLKESAFVKDLLAMMRRVIVGQQYFMERMVVALLANGHILVESVPGLAKTLSIMTLSKCVNASFQRVQFTPDLLPADIIGTLIYNAQKGSFDVKKGPYSPISSLPTRLIVRRARCRQHFSKPCRSVRSL